MNIKIQFMGGIANGIGDEGTRMVSEALKFNISLTKMYLT